MKTKTDKISFPAPPQPAQAEKRVYARLVRRGGQLIFVSPFAITGDAIAQAVADERASR